MNKKQLFAVFLLAFPLHSFAHWPLPIPVAGLHTKPIQKATNEGFKKVVTVAGTTLISLFAANAIVIGYLGNAYQSGELIPEDEAQAQHAKEHPYQAASQFVFESFKSTLQSAALTVHDMRAQAEAALKELTTQKTFASSPRTEDQGIDEQIRALVEPRS